MKVLLIQISLQFIYENWIFFQLKDWFIAVHEKTFIKLKMKLHFKSCSFTQKCKRILRKIQKENLLFALNVIYISNEIEASCISGKVCIKYKLHTPLELLIPPIKIRKYQDIIAWRKKKSTVCYYLAKNESVEIIG